MTDVASRSATASFAAVQFGRVRTPAAAVAWAVSPRPIGYPDAVAAMERRVGQIHDDGATELVWLVEHPALYTAGTSARDSDLLSPTRFPVYRTGRGGQHTYHGPGQRIAYLMLDLESRKPDLRAFVTTVEEWLIRTVGTFGITARRSQGRIGVWVPRPDKGPGREDKIAAIGVRVRHWVTFHGAALNVDPVLEHFSGIIPCGIKDQGVTSLADLGVMVSRSAVDAALRREFTALFGPTVSVSEAP